MRALVFTAPGVVELREELAPVPQSDETMIEVRASSICGSELHGFRSVGFRVPPLIMGHEFAGVGPDGRRYVVNPLISCGSCPACRRGAPQVCERRQLIGAQRDGGFAELVAVPDHALHELPEEIDWLGAALIEPLANAVHAWSLVGAAVSRVGIIGAGPIGILCALLGRTRGVEVVTADLSSNRRATAAGLGIASVEQLDGEFDAVIDAVGAPVTRRDAVDRVRAGGTAVWIGLATDETELRGNGVVRHEKRIVGSFAYTPDEFAEAIGLAAKIDLEWVTPVPFADAEQVFYSLASGHRAIAKAVIMFDGSER